MSKNKPITITEAKKLIARELHSKNIGCDRLSGRTIGFSDLARGSAIFVKIHGWKPNPVWKDLQKVAHDNGFCIESGR